MQKPMRQEKLRAVEIPFGIWTEHSDPKTGSNVPGQGVHRFYRFNGVARLDELTIPFAGGPRNVKVFAYPHDLNAPTLLFDGELPQGDAGAWFRIRLDGTEARAASVFCDETYPVPVAFHNWHGTTYSVPFAVLKGVSWYGRDIDGTRHQPPYGPPLKKGSIRARGGANQTVEVNPYEVKFSSPYLTVAFSLKRPMMTHFGWDALGQGYSSENTLYRRAMMEADRGGGRPPGANGPYFCHLLYDGTPYLWTGAVEVDGNRIRYDGLRLASGLTVWAEFEVGERELRLSLRQDVEEEMTVLDAHAWGFMWDGRRVPSLSTNAMPIRGSRRNGGVVPQGAWNLSGLGAVNFSPDGDEKNVAFQVDSTGFQGRLGFSGIQIATEHLPLGPVRLQAGRHEVSFRLAVKLLQPRIKKGGLPVHDGMRRAWGSIFAFRPEGGGFSNNGFSGNCQNCLLFPADLAAYTDVHGDGPDVVELIRYGASLAVQGGPGYACQWEQALDAAPSLGISIGRVHQVRPDGAWLKELWPYLKRPFTFILENTDETGLYYSRFRSGNSGSREWSSNAYDTVSFGHYDAYSLALAYRALMGGVAVARDAGDIALSERCRAAAERIKVQYAPTLLNPETGLISGWKSADGALHDHAYTFVNGMAICFGLVDDARARSILATLEAMRLEIDHDDFRYGICPNLKPVPWTDYKSDVLASPLRDDGFDTFGMFINGGLMPTLGNFYLRALSVHGYQAAADRICEDLLESYAQRRFEGQLYSGVEYFTMDGSPCGYEGTLTHGYHVLLAIALHRGWVESLEPEWWPA